MDPIRTVTLYSKEGCHLCELARDVILRTGGEAAFNFNEISLEETDPRYGEYSDLFPVIAVDGRVVAYWRIEREQLLEFLRNALSADQ